MSDFLRVFRPFFWLCVGLFLGGLSVSVFAVEEINATWPTSGQYPSANRTAAFSCGATLSGGDSKFEFATGEITGSGINGVIQSVDNPYKHWSGGYYYGWTDKGVEHACLVYAKKPICPDGWKWDGGEYCVKAEIVCPADAFGNSSISAVLTGEPKGNQVCINSCVYTGSKVLCSPTLSGGTTSGGDAVSLAKVCEISGPFTAAKRSCDASSNGEPNIAKPYAEPPKPWYDNGKGIADCASSGGSWGSVNGKEMCVRGPETKPGAGSGAGTSGSVSDTKTKTESTSDGGSKTTDTKTDTTCTDGKCTTTTTTTTTITNSDGTKTTSSDTKTEDTSQTPFCVANPSNSLCAKNSFGGDCSAGFSCSGDSVQCALARVTHEARCASKWLTTPGDPTTSTAKVEEKAIDTKFEWNPFGTDMTCPPDKHVVTMAGISVDWTFSDFCTFANNIRPIVIILGWITAAYIVFGYSNKKDD